LCNLSDTTAIVDEMAADLQRWLSLQYCIQDAGLGPVVTTTTTTTGGEIR